VKNHQEILKRTLNEGTFSEWRREDAAAINEGQMVLATLQRNATGAESYVQNLRQYLADGNTEGSNMAMEAILNHLATLAEVLCPDAAGHIVKAADCFVGKGL
jgi:hypothetical protein